MKNYLLKIPAEKRKIADSLLERNMTKDKINLKCGLNKKKCKVFINFKKTNSPLVDANDNKNASFSNCCFLT